MTARSFRVCFFASVVKSSCNFEGDKGFPGPVGARRQESGHRLDNGSPYWRIQLDQDLLDTISAIYPEWFKDCTISRASTSGTNASTSLQLGSSISNNSSSSNSSADSNSPCSSNSCSNSASATAAPADSTSELYVKRESSPRKIGKTESKLKSKLRKIEGLLKGRKDKRTQIKEERDGHGSKKTSKLFSSKDKVADIVLKKITNGAKMAEGNQSPPKVEVDDSPLQQSMERNKESLKVKLMLRRPYNQLVAQGIMPPLKTPPAFHEQAKQLERRKTGDLLKQKIQRRPGRDELVRQHILDAESHVDPSIAEKHRQLKKAKLADQLNDQLSHRPGPLELIQKNILHTEEPIERAVKEGHIPFKATSEGQVTKPQHPDHYITFEDDSQSSEGGVPSPPVAAASSTASLATLAVPGGQASSTDVLEAAAVASSPIVVSLSLPTSDCSAVVVTSSSPVFQNSRGSLVAGSKPALQTTLAGLCGTVVATSAGQELQQQHQQQAQQLTAAQVADSPPLFISIASPAGSLSSTTLLPLAPAPSPMSLGSTTSSLSPLSNISIASPPAPPAAITPRPQPSPIAVASGAQQRSDAPGKDKNRKKSKTKSQPKARTIKFHEYKGPPNAQKSNDAISGLSSSQHNETKYEILLQQQQLFLQWQVEVRNKFPQLILPASQKPPIALTTTSSVASDSGSLSGMSVNAPSPAPSNASSSQSEQPPLRPLGKLEDMKVSDLKVELKRRNLPVSGSKPQLIERLKPFTELSSSNATPSTNGHHVAHGHILMDTAAPMSIDDASSHKSPNSIKDEPITSPRSDSSHGSEHEDSSSPPGDKKLKEHYRKKIEILQRELSRVQSQPQNPVRGVQKLMLQQHIHNKLQQQELTRQMHQLQQMQQMHQQQQQQQQQQLQSQQAQQIALQQLSTKANLAAFLQAQPNNATIIDSATLTAINNKKNQSKNANATTTTVQVPAAIVLNLAKPNLTKLNGSIIGALVAQAQSQQLVAASVNDVKPPPPQYDEAAKLLKVKIEPTQKATVKSQMVDDVLEILINNGELPPSAAQEPVTPTTPNRQLPQGLVLSAADSPTQSLVFTAASPMEVTQNECASPTPQQQPPPPPPPLPLATFSVQLPSELQQQQQQQQHQQQHQQQQHQQQHHHHHHHHHQHERLSSFAAELLSGESDLEAAMLLSPQLVQHGSPDPQPPQEVTSSDHANLDLKEFGIDFDNMDFSQLECDFGVKMNETSQEFMDISDVPMDMDSEWLDLINPSPQSSVTTTTSIATTTANQMTASSSSQINNDLYDPMLANSQDTFEDIFDPDFKMAGDLSLNWDNGQVDFAT